nr:MAG TPA: hypothetical protein [Caudoviricetes sp.]
MSSRHPPPLLYTKPIICKNTKNYIITRLTLTKETSRVITTK